MNRTRYILFHLIFCLANSLLWGQNFTSYFTGDTTDAESNPLGGVCMMGGATEDDEAMKWFLNRADGGDVLVIRASGSDGYNDYLYSELGITVNSVETIVFHNATAAQDSYVQQQLAQAEAIWIAGGNQWNYVSFWRNSPIDSLINSRVNAGAVIGGTSAGMAILGGIYFTAENGTVQSQTALNDPYDAGVQISQDSFLHLSYLNTVITDTHYDDPDRRGRHTTFLARAMTDWGIAAQGIACDEYTAVCIDTDGKAYVYGQYPQFEDNAYFIQANCELAENGPEQCTSGLPLDWHHNGEALKVYRIRGTMAGDKYFDLNDWKSGVGGEWVHWSSQQGSFVEAVGDSIDCPATSIEQPDQDSFSIYPNPARNQLWIESESHLIQAVQLFNSVGQSVLFKSSFPIQRFELELGAMNPGVYVLELEHAQGQFRQKILIH